MFGKTAIAVGVIVVVCGSVMTTEAEAQRRGTSTLRDALKQRAQAERRRRQSETSKAPEREGSRLDDLRKAVRKRIEEEGSQTQSKTSNLDAFRDAVRKRLADEGIQPQGERTTRRIDAGRIADEIGADGLRELNRHGFTLPGHEAGEANAGRARRIVLPDRPIDFDEQLGVIGPIIPDNNAGRRVKIQTYRFRHVVLIKVTNLRTGKVTWIVRRRGWPPGQILAVLSRGAGNLGNKLDDIKGGSPWKAFLQLDRLAAFDKTVDEVSPEEQRQLANVLKRFEQVRNNPQYNKITELPEFQSTYNNIQSLMDKFQAGAKPSEPPAIGVPGTKKGSQSNSSKPGLKFDAKPGLKFDAKPGFKVETKPGYKVELETKKKG